MSRGGGWGNGGWVEGVGRGVGRVVGAPVLSAQGLACKPFPGWVELQGPRKPPGNPSVAGNEYQASEALLPRPFRATWPPWSGASR